MKFEEYYRRFNSVTLWDHSKKSHKENHWNKCWLCDNELTVDQCFSWSMGILNYRCHQTGQIVSWWVNENGEYTKNENYESEVAQFKKSYYKNV